MRYVVSRRDSPAPVWSAVPAPSFTQGVAASYSLSAICSISTGADITYSSVGTALPSGVTINNSSKTLDYNGVGGATTASGVRLRATASGVSTDSALFSLTIQAAGAATDIATFSLTSATGGTLLPFAIGHAFRQGDVPAGFYLVADDATVRTSIMATWPDGSAKHAVTAGRRTLSGGSPSSILLRRQTSAPSGSVIGESFLTSSGVTASVAHSTYGTVSLATLIGTSALHRTHFANSECAEFVYQAPFPSDTHLVAFFHVRIWSSGRYRVRVAVDSGRAGPSMTGSAAKSGTFTVVVAGSTVYSASTAMPRYSGWSVVGWGGGADPEISVAHDVAYLKATKLVPHVGYTGASAATLNGLAQTYSPMQLRNYEQTMGAGGYQPAIGLVPNWMALYLQSADARAYRAVLASDESYRSYSVNRREPATMRPIAFASYPTLGYESEDTNQTGDSNANVWEIAHHPNGGYCAYLLTGEYFHLETLHFNANMTYLYSVPSLGSGTARLFRGQTRAKGWSVRTLASAAGITPDGDALKSQYRDYLATNIDAWDAQHVVTGTPMTGLVNASADLESESGIQYRIWFYDFVSQAMGFAWDLEPGLTGFGRVRHRNLRDWFYRSIVGRLGAGGANEYCFQDAGVYNNTVASGSSTGTTANYYSNWKDVYDASVAAGNFASAACSAGGALRNSSANVGNPGAFAQSYWGNIQPSIAYAVDHDFPGAGAARARMTGASNWSADSAGFVNVAVWGITPRTPTAPGYALPAVGAAKYIQSTTSSDSVRPSSHTYNQWAYSVFGSYGSGAFIESYSQYGAYVLAGTGGHNSPPNVGALVFDFATGEWTLLDNSNGVAQRSSDYPLSQLNGSPYYEISGTTVPAPPHTYQTAIEIPTDYGGGARGAYAFITRGAAAVESVTSTASHKFDLSTRAWSRVTTAQAPFAGFEGTVLHDRQARRYYLMPGTSSAFNSRTSLAILDPVTWTWTSSASFPFASAGADYPTYVLDPLRRVICVFFGDNSARVLDLQNITAGWANMSLSGALPSNKGTWCFYPPDGRYYRLGYSGGNTLNRITPPSRNFRTATWTVDTVAVGGDTVPPFGDGGFPISEASGTHSYRTLSYVPALRCLSWVSGAATPVSTQRQVTLIRPA
jgi:hypothetical protein